MYMEAPEFYMGDYYGGAAAVDFKPEKNAGESFAVDDLLDFSNEDVMITDGLFDNVAGNSTDSSTVTAVDSSGDGHFSPSATNFGHRSGFSADSHFSGELCVPYDELAQLEWLSNFVEDSFAAEQNSFQMLSGPGSGPKPLTPDSSSSSTRPDTISKNNAICIPEIPLPGKARSKRSRASPGDWSTRLLHVNSQKTTPSKKRESAASNAEPTGRRCLHCAAEKTPQWRTGPMGPKTLCNACGVRYKSGRLVPEYRPAASPTFVSTKHSNSHRKVLELRRQKELLHSQPPRQHPFVGQSSIFDVSNGGDEFLIQPHGGQEFRHMI